MLINSINPKFNQISGYKNNIRRKTYTNQINLLQSRNSKYGQISFGNYYTPQNEIEAQIHDFEMSVNSRKEELFQYFDKIKIDFDKTGEYKSIKDNLESIFKGDTEECQLNNLYHKTKGENVPSILENGFDVKKIRETEFGPGIYFGQSESAVTIYKGKLLTASFSGRLAKSICADKYPQFRSSILDSMQKYLCNDSKNIQYMFGQWGVLNKYINEYCRQLIVDKLKIDGIDTNEYLVIFNPNTISNIQEKEMPYNNY